MTSKTIVVGLIALAFVGGSITTGSMSYAESGGIPQAVSDLESQFVGIQEFLIGLDSRVTQNEADIANIELIPGPQGIQGETGEVGPQGEQGIPGPQGIAGQDGQNALPLSTYTEWKRVMVSPNTAPYIIVSCETGDALISGGIIKSHSTMEIFENRPDFNTEAPAPFVSENWVVRAYNHATVSLPLDGFAVCVDQTP